MRRWSPKRLTILGGVAVAVIAAGTAAVFSQTGGANANEAAWIWPDVPGVSVTADATTLTMAKRNAVTAESIREIAGVDERGGRHQLLAGRGSAGQICIADRTPVDIGEFECIGAESDKLAVIYSQVEGGSSTSTVDKSSIVGVGRSDVARIVITTQDGLDRSMDLNQWNGFSYVATDKASLPATLVAYNGNDEVLQEQKFSYLPPG